MPVKPQTVERILARMARGQHGLVTRAAMLDAGITRNQIQERVRSGALIRVHRGVYRVGHAAPSLRAHYLGAVLACGEGALLGGRAAAHLMAMIRGRPPVPEVLCPTQRNVRGVITHQVKTLSPPDGWTHEGVPCTKPARTLVDLAPRLSSEALARTAHEAGVRYRTTPRQVEGVLARWPTAPGATKLRAVVSGDAAVSLSVLESRFLKLLREAALPLPVTNKPAGSHRVDCRWPAQRLTVELDSYRFHSSRHAWERDHRREREAYARGDALRRYTYGDVFEDPRPMLAELRALL